MTKADLINKIYGNTKGSFTKTQIGNALDACLDSITEALAEGESITFTGFGSLKVATRAARTGRNPRTGASINIPAQKAVKFTSGKALREAVK